MVASNSEHLLRYRASNGDVTFGAGGRGGSWASSSVPAGVRRRRSCQDVLYGADVGVAEWMSEEDACGVKWRQLGPAVYASFEDMSDLQAQPSPMGSIINAPLMQPSSSPLYTRAHPRHRRRSPGPLGTHRGGFMYRFIKNRIRLHTAASLARPLSSIRPLGLHRHTSPHRPTVA
ncbi:hypothetical protein GUJ93_ZPchr0014g47342 [Zizania palustris]|uniref:Uncharacterized protein n=1 Tax=Zizania palustris TaxID=103762 RepID=A0A8J5W5M3_ZIZPA|nr:hypothetical protein GUJ93_ZPchr0014g47342 [Zizania palustris]